MGVVQVSADEIVHVITVGDGFVPAAGTVRVSGLVASTGVARGADRGIGGVDVDHVLVHVVFVGVVQMPLVQIVHVVAVLDGKVAAVGFVVMAVVGVFRTTHG